MEMTANVENITLDEPTWTTMGQCIVETFELLTCTYMETRTFP